MDRHDLPRGGGLVHQVAQQCGAKPLAAMFGQEGDVDDTCSLGQRSMIEAADIFAGVHRNQPVGVRIMSLLVRMLRTELCSRNAGFSASHQGDDREFVDPCRSVDPREERQVGVGHAAKGQTGTGRAAQPNGTLRDMPTSRIDSIRRAAGRRPAARCRRFSVR